MNFLTYFLGIDHQIEMIEEYTALLACAGDCGRHPLQSAKLNDRRKAIEDVYQYAKKIGWKEYKGSLYCPQCLDEVRK
jgi:uncharacterized CHY-type Zn-finger protein